MSMIVKTSTKTRWYRENQKKSHNPNAQATTVDCFTMNSTNNVGKYCNQRKPPKKIEI